MKSALVIDDHPITHLGASRLLADLGYDPVGQAMSGQEALAQLAGGASPALIVLDLNLPETGGFELIAPLKTAAPRARVLIFSMNDQTGFAARAMQAGAHGFLSKNAPPGDFREAVRALEAGEMYLSGKHAMALAAIGAGVSADPLAGLSPRESQVLGAIGRGLSLQAIADDLGVSYKTAANTSSALKKKLNVDSMNGLMKIAMEAGL